MIRIVSKKDGFRRAGMAHSGSKNYPDGTFTKEQLAQLAAEPNLVVEELPDPEEETAGGAEEVSENAAAAAKKRK